MSVFSLMCLFMLTTLSRVIIEKRIYEQQKYVRGQLSQHASVCREKAKYSCVVGKSSGTAERSSSHSHGSRSRDIALVDVVHVHANVVHALVRPIVVTLQGFFRDPSLGRIWTRMV